MSKSAVSRRVLMAALVAGAFVLPGQSQSARANHEANHKIGLEGYCPVCIVAVHKWEKGRPEINSTYDGITYHFPSEAIKRKFDASPAKYVPALGGDCIVCYAKLGKRVPGNIRHASLHNNRLYLFPSDQEKRAFDNGPANFENTDLAENGECVVCLKKVNKHVAGSSRFTELHNGFRYLFPSANEQAEFRRNPDQYVSAPMMEKSDSKMSMMNESEKSAMKDSARQQSVTVTGRSGCAGCEHGVTPLANSDELGLAVNTLDGRIIVVEEAHKLNPDVYAARFQGQRLEVAGMVIKTEGKISWLKPSSLRVLN